MDAGPVEPPRFSDVSTPAHLLGSTESPGMSSFVQVVGGFVSAASGDGHLLLTYYDFLAASPCATFDPEPEIVRFVCNPLSGELFRLPDIGGSRTTLRKRHMGLLTQAGGEHGDGPPDRFAVADISPLHGRVVERFLSEKGQWESVLASPCQSPLVREMKVNQETVAFGGRLWWVDLTLGAVSVDPFSERPELRFVELPLGSMITEKGDFSSAAEHFHFMREMAMYRRIGVSEGRLRYAEVYPGGSFLLRSFALDGQGAGWTLEHEVTLRQVLADGGYLTQEKTEEPQIAVLDPLNASVMYLTVGEHIVGVDMHKGKVIGSSPLQDEYDSLVPCVLPQWLRSSRIPTAGKNDVMEETDVRCSDA